MRLPITQVQLVTEFVTFLLCLASICTQLAVLDYYFVLYQGSLLWLVWSLGDAVVLGALLWLLSDMVHFQKRYCERRPLGNDANIHYAYAAWLLYSLVLSGKAYVVFFYVKPLASEDDARQLKLILSVSALAFFLLAGSHHFTEPESSRQNYIAFLSCFIALDILDSILFLQLLIDKGTNQAIADNHPLQATILFLACFNFVLPTYPLYKLRYRGANANYKPGLNEKFYELFYFASVNAPYLVVRAYFYSKARNSADAYFFIMKNVIMVLVSVRELWVTFIEYEQLNEQKSGVDLTFEQYERAKEGIED